MLILVNCQFHFYLYLPNITPAKYSTYRMHTNVIISYYCILRGCIKGFNCSITTIMCEDGSYRTVVG